MCHICSAATSPSWTSVAPAPLLSATGFRLRPSSVLHDDLRCCHRRVRPRRQDEPRVRHRAVFCTELSGGAVPYDRRPDSVRCGGVCRHSAAPGALLKSAAAGCEPFLVNSLLPRPSACPAWPFAAPIAARCEPILAFPLLPGLSTCPAWPSAASVAARCEPFSENRLTPAPCNSGSGPGTMAAGAREQAASCDAFVLSRRLPAPDAPPSRTSPVCLIAKNLSNSLRTTAL